jgi:hypothetical protein
MHGLFYKTFSNYIERKHCALSSKKKKRKRKTPLSGILLHKGRVAGILLVVFLEIKQKTFGGGHVRSYSSLIAAPIWGAAHRHISWADSLLATGAFSSFFCSVFFFVFFIFLPFFYFFLSVSKSDFLKSKQISNLNIFRI